MTYVSRKTRIIVSRWTDECDAEYTLKAIRKRSDGRLKRYASCDDSRAWINNNCIKYEHLVDFMSNGEYLGKKPYRLYGRFIPVPILFKLAEKTTVIDDDESGNNEKGSKSEKANVRFKNKTKVGDPEKRSNSDSGSQDSGLEPKVSYSKLELEKTMLERRLCQCTCLLNKAMGKLERIDGMISPPCYQSENTENIEQNKEIQNAFANSKLKCSCSSRKNLSENLLPSKSYAKKFRESAKCAELMRKISGLREKLKKIQECKLEICQKIRASQKRAEMCGSSNQITELYSHREQAYAKKLEKLMAEKGRLLYEMCQTLTCLNSLKRASRSSIAFNKNRSKTNRNSTEFACERPKNPTDRCRCPCSQIVESTDSEKVRSSDFSSGEYGECGEYGESDMNEEYSQARDCDTNNYSETPETGNNTSGMYPDEDSFYSETCSGDEEFKQDTDSQRGNKYSDASTVEVVDVEKETPTLKKEEEEEEEEENSKDNNENTQEKESTKKSKVSFLCPQPTCKRVVDSDDLEDYEQSLTPDQQALILDIVKSIENRRPKTSPTTKKERNSIVQEQEKSNRDAKRQTSESHVPKRLTKSETTMQEIEKTLRNYEQRLSQLDCLEYRINNLQHKASEADELKDSLEAFKSEVQRQKMAEREKANRELSKLCTENWELKRHVQQLTAKFEAQCRKIQNLKFSSRQKEREMECEAEELKKELSEYRDRFEHQRKCISKWESLVAVQRTEIESLMNHIRKLTTMKEEANCNAYQSKKYVQRSRSYSPEMKMRGSPCRGKTSTRNSRPADDEEDSSCCCNEYSQVQEDNRRRSQQRSSDRVYSPVPRTRGSWCN